MDKKCPFTGNVSIRGRILTGVVKSMKMKRTIVIRRDYLHYIKKYKRFEKRHKNISVHMSPCFRCAVERGRVCVRVCVCVRVGVSGCGGGCVGVDVCMRVCVCAVWTCTCLCVYVIELGLFTLEPNVHWKISHPMRIQSVLNPLPLNPLPVVVSSGLSNCVHTEPHPTAIHVTRRAFIGLSVYVYT